jgi:predicted nucleotidyltransferase
MVGIVQANFLLIIDACKMYHVKSLYLFGSALRAIDFGEKSDIDFLVEFNYADPTNNENVFEGVENLQAFELALKNITERKIDLIQEIYIRNKYLKYFINKEKKLIYGIS